MNLAQLCKRAVVSIEAGASIRDAARLMRAQHVGALVVTADADGRRDAIGVVTDRDIADAVAAHDLSPAEVFVGAIASRPLHSAPASASAAEAAEAMQRTGVRRLVVIDGEGAVIGLLSSDDLLPALIEPLQALAAAFRAGIVREESARSALAASTPRPVFLPMGTPGMRA